jgi:hypothetical protein
LVEEAFGWAKTIAGMAKVKVRRLPRALYRFTFALAAYNLIRMRRLVAEASGGGGAPVEQLRQSDSPEKRCSHV